MSDKVMSNILDEVANDTGSDTSHNLLSKIN